MGKARVLTEGLVRGSLIYLALPLLIGNILQQLYNTADAVIIGRWVNSAAFGAVGVAGTVMNLFIFVLSGACSGIMVLFSQSYGAGDLGTFRRRSGNGKRRRNRKFRQCGECRRNGRFGRC